MEDNKVSYFCLGLGLGVAVGILFAPKSGAETREFLRSSAEDGADYVRRASGDLRDNASDLMDRGRQTLNRKKENLAAAVEAGKQAYRDALSNPQVD